VEGKTENSKMTVVISWYFLKILMAVKKTLQTSEMTFGDSYKHGTTTDSLLMETYGIAK
jgi:hypothetical protein